MNEMAIALADDVRFGFANGHWLGGRGLMKPPPDARPVEPPYIIQELPLLLICLFNCCFQWV